MKKTITLFVLLLISFTSFAQVNPMDYMAIVRVDGENSSAVLSELKSRILSQVPLKNQNIQESDFTMGTMLIPIKPSSTKLEMYSTITEISMKLLDCKKGSFDNPEKCNVEAKDEQNWNSLNFGNWFYRIQEEGQMRFYTAAKTIRFENLDREIADKIVAISAQVEKEKKSGANKPLLDIETKVLRCPLDSTHTFKCK